LTQNAIREEFFKFMDDDITCFDLYQSFVSKSFDPNYNYESLEKIGDAALKSGMIKYLYEQDNKFNYDMGADGITYYITKYLDKKNLSMVSKTLKFAELAKFNGVQSSTLHEDIFEAFVGAILSTGDAFSPGLGYFMCDRFARSIAGPGPLPGKDTGFLNFKFTPDEFLTAVPPFTWVKEIFDVLKPTIRGDKEQMGFRYYNVGNLVACDYVIPEILRYSIADFYGLDIPHNILLVSIKPTSPDTVEEEISEMVRTELQARGINDRFIYVLRMAKMYGKLGSIGFKYNDALKAKILKNGLVAVLSKYDKDKQLLYLNEVTINTDTSRLRKFTLRIVAARNANRDDNKILLEMYNEYVGMA
jgi:hypothetical protein